MFNNETRVVFHGSNGETVEFANRPVFADPETVDALNDPSPSTEPDDWRENLARNFFGMDWAQLQARASEQASQKHWVPAGRAVGKAYHTVTRDDLEDAPSRLQEPVLTRQSIVTRVVTGPLFGTETLVSSVEDVPCDNPNLYQQPKPGKQRKRAQWKTEQQRKGAK